MTMHANIGGSTTGTGRHVLALLCAVPLLVAGAGPLNYRAPIRNVIIVTLDTTRADYLPAYGFANLETPALDRIAREGVLFEQATTTAPLTLPAHCTIFTGLFPPHHQVRDNADRALADDQTTLAEVLRAHGMRTAAFVGSIVVGADRGLKQGFDTYSAPSRTDLRERHRRPGHVVIDDVLGWLDQQGENPFFAWVHLYDAHAPYALPEPYRTMYEDAPYLGAIAFLDAQVARLMTALEKHHALERTLLVVASDHGESLGDHGEDGHGIFVYQSTLHVPLVMRVPGVVPRRVTDVTRLTDVMPTVLDLLGIAGPSMDGVSLAPLMSGRRRTLDLEAYSESVYPARFGWSALHALRAGRFKFVSAPRPELYDLDVDPNERRNLYAERTPLAAAMAARVATLAGARAPDRVDSPMDPESAAQLAALGYIGHVVAARSPGVDEAAVDPKDCIGRYNDLVRLRGRDPASAWAAMAGSSATDGCVARRVNSPGIRPPRALRAGRIAALGVNRTSGTQH